MLEFDEVGTSTPQPSLKSRMASAASSDYYCMTFDEPEEMDDVTLSSSATSKRPSDCSLDEAVRGAHKQTQLLAQQNMDLNDKLTRQSEELAEARAQLRGYSGPLGLENASDEEIIRLEAFEKGSIKHSGFLEVYNVPEFARIIVCELKPTLARLLTKNLPAYLLVAAFRNHDEKRDETALTGLFSSVHLVLKDTISRSHDLDLLSLWLVNLWRLFNLLRQYSGEDSQPEWHVANTETQNSYRFKAYDVAPIRDQLKLRIEECYTSLMKKAIEHVLSPKIVPGILQHESSSDLMTAGQERRDRNSGSVESQRKSLDDLLQFMEIVHTKLTTYGGDDIVVKQVIGQMARWMCALALNYMMFRRELCNFEKAIQIKHNVTQIQNWLNAKGLSDCRDHFEPLVQACHLLQSRKDPSNLDTLCGEMTSRLKPRQVVAILQHYDPSDEMEDGLSPEFLVQIQKKLNERAIANNDPIEDKPEVEKTYEWPIDVHLEEVDQKAVVVFGEKDGIKLRYYVKSVNGETVSGTRLQLGAQQVNVLEYLQEEDHYPVTVKFAAPTVSTNEKIILSSMFHSLFTIAVQLSPCQKSSGVEVLETTQFKLFCLQSRTGVKFVVITSAASNIAADSLLSKMYELYTDFALKNPFYSIDMPIRAQKFDEAIKTLLERAEKNNGAVTF